MPCFRTLLQQNWKLMVLPNSARFLAHSVEWVYKWKIENPTRTGQICILWNKTWLPSFDLAHCLLYCRLYCHCYRYWKRTTSRMRSAMYNWPKNYILQQREMKSSQTAGACLNKVVYKWHFKKPVQLNNVVFNDILQQTHWVNKL